MPGMRPREKSAMSANAAGEKSRSVTAQASHRSTTRTDVDLPSTVT